MSLLASYRASRGENNDGYRTGSVDNPLSANHLSTLPYATSSSSSTSFHSSLPANAASSSCQRDNSSSVSASRSVLTRISRVIPVTILVTLILAAVGGISIMKRTSSSSLTPNITPLYPFSARLHGPQTEAIETTWNDSLVVNTECGSYLGIAEDEGFVFKGIRYGKAPINSLRWSVTVPIWNDSESCDRLAKKKATKFGGPCFQINPYSKRFQGTEDCLFINIWTPTLNESANLDVMVWIHGGFLQFGSGHDPGLRPSSRLAVNLNTVFVSFNYRLYTLGFLNLNDSLNSGNQSSDITGNYGLTDQLTALEWIQRNIALFGGNPRQVTLFGPDAGAASILAHLTNPEAVKFFNKAWLIGPTLFLNRSSETTNHVQHFINRTQCKTVDCLRRLSPEKVTQCWLGDNDPSFRIIDQNDLPIIGIYPEQFIHVDGVTVREFLPFSESSLGSIHQIPLLLGTSAQAIELWPGIEQLRNWTWIQYKKYVTTSLDSFGPNLTEAALQLYPIPEAGSDMLPATNDNVNSSSSNNTNSTDEKIFMTPELLYAIMVSDIRQNCPVDSVFQKLSEKWKKPIYRYISSGEPSNPIRVYEYESKYSFHLWDAIAFFDTVNQFIRHPTQFDLNYRDIVQELIHSFITDTTEFLPKPFPSSVAILTNSNQSIVPAYSPERCHFWQKQGLNSYVWAG